MNAAVSMIDTPADKARLRCLWISRDIPFPQDAGDRIYSGNLAAALTRANAEVCYLGYLQPDAAPLPNHWVSQWIAVTGAKRDSRLALLSRYPHIAAVHATTAYRKLLQEYLAQSWDAIVLDGYASGWALPHCLQARNNSATRPLIIYVSHNHEESLWRAMLNATPIASLKRIGIWQNYRKARWLERELTKHADLVSAITAEDARDYAVQRSHQKNRINPIVLMPGYIGTRKTNRQITHDTPRHVLVIGSFRWSIKQENLRRLIAAADQEFFAHGITLDIVGDVPAELLRELKPQVRATKFHGFVADLSPYLEQTRIALVPDVVGGGFKLKFLDYVFGRVPIATITSAAAGIPAALAQHMICCKDLETLVHTVTREINDLKKLNLLHNHVYMQAESLYDWDTSGERLATVIRRYREQA